MIRIATKEDLPEISKLWEDMVLEARPEFKPDLNKWVVLGNALFDTGLYHVVVFEEDNKIVGFIDGMMFDEPSTGEKHGVAQHFYVIPEYRKTLVSVELYEEIMYLAVKNGSEALELFCFPEMEEYWKGKGFNKERILMRRKINV